MADEEVFFEKDKKYDDEIVDGPNDSDDFVLLFSSKQNQRMLVYFSIGLLISILICSIYRWYRVKVPSPGEIMLTSFDNLPKYGSITTTGPTTSPTYIQIQSPFDKVSQQVQDSNNLEDGHGPVKFSDSTEGRTAAMTAMFEKKLETHSRYQNVVNGMQHANRQYSI